ncbi:uncharacterized protein LOC135822854 isoform X1 [Sycon ciliatum]|uniref:uncharacterized protein LOC135822854 isoform X1 n=1 Tax=Sycon ciliatum TaxID=27933 RepID=UPI0031F6C536
MFNRSQGGKRGEENRAASRKSSGFNLFMETPRGTARIRPEETPLQTAIQDRLLRNSDSATRHNLQSSMRTSAMSRLLFAKDDVRPQSSATRRTSHGSSLPSTSGHGQSSGTPALHQRPAGHLPSANGQPVWSGETPSRRPYDHEAQLEHYKKMALKVQRAKNRQQKQSKLFKMMEDSTGHKSTARSNPTHYNDVAQRMQSTTSSRPWFAQKYQEAAGQRKENVAKGPPASTGIPQSIANSRSSLASRQSSSLHKQQHAQQKNGSVAAQTGQMPSARTPSDTLLEMMRGTVKEHYIKRYRQRRRRHTWDSDSDSHAEEEDEDEEKDLAKLLNIDPDECVDYSSQELIAMYNGEDIDTWKKKRESSEEEEETEEEANQEPRVENSPTKSPAPEQTIANVPEEMATAPQEAKLKEYDDGFNSEDLWDDANWFPLTPPSTSDNNQATTGVHISVKAPELGVVRHRADNPVVSIPTLPVSSDSDRSRSPLLHTHHHDRDPANHSVQSCASHRTAHAEIMNTQSPPDSPDNVPPSPPGPHELPVCSPSTGPPERSRLTEDEVMYHAIQMHNHAIGLPSSNGGWPWEVEP